MPAPGTQPLKLHWSSGKPNFGDWLSPALCGLLSGRPIEHTSPEDCDMIAVGSILHRLKNGWFARPVHVWGTGFIEEVKPVRLKHHVHAVRGWNTAKLLRGMEVTAVGDPGLLAHLLLPQPREIEKRHRLGLAPHYKDKESPRVRELAAQIPGSTILNVFSPPIEVLKRVAECEFILSSSLHGLIVSDSLGVPNMWMELSEGVRGSGFKFADYYSAFGLKDMQPAQLRDGLSEALLQEWTRRYERPELARVQKDLAASFPFKKAAASAD